jgi:hypothetical protein
MSETTWISNGSKYHDREEHESALGDVSTVAPFPGEADSPSPTPMITRCEWGHGPGRPQVRFLGGALRCSADSESPSPKEST